MKLALINAKTDLEVMVDRSNLGPEAISNHFEEDARINKIISVEKQNIIKSKDKLALEKNLDGVNEFNERLYDIVLKGKEENNFPIILGGEHSLAIATVLASIKDEQNLGIIWIDSHGDYNTFEITRTGNLHGLPLATLNNKTENIAVNLLDKLVSSLTSN